MTPRTERVAWFALFAAGLCAVGLGLVVSPALLLRHSVVPDGAIDARMLAMLPLLRAAAIGIGSLVVAGSAWALRRPARLRGLLQRVPLPIGTLVAVLGVYAGLMVLHAALRVSGLETGASFFFPVAVFQPMLHAEGTPYLAGFLALLAVVLWRPPLGGAGMTWLIGLALIVAGNLVQGGFVAGFHRPFTLGQIEYYHDALAIVDGEAWLGDFNLSQPSLLTHSRTHPPFAVLLHHVILNAGGGLTTLALVFTLVTSASIPLVYAMLRELGVERARSAQLGWLMAALPAVNIYGAVTLDGVVSAAAALCVYGMILITRSRKLALGIPLFVAGWLAASALTFGAVFLCLLAGLLALLEWHRSRRLGMVAAIGVTACFGIAAWQFLLGRYGYDHVQAFFTASALENPQGFRGFAEPLRYVVTRVECVLELGLFFSFAALAVVTSRFSLRAHEEERHPTAWTYFLAASAVLVAVFLTGAYRSAETARACLFFYPFLVFALARESPQTLRLLTLLAGLQTACMQWVGDFHW